MLLSFNRIQEFVISSTLCFTSYSWSVRIHFYCLLYSFWSMAECSYYVCTLLSENHGSVLLNMQ